MFLSGQEEDFFTKKYTEEPCTQIGMFHYPPHTPVGEGDKEVFGSGEHTDYGNLTLLLQDDVGGLQVKTKDGIWIDIPPIPGALVINVGDMLEGWTNGAYKAARHRVKTSLKHRLSIAVFFDPSLECVISPIPIEKTMIPTEEDQTELPLKYPLRYGDYILMKYTGIFKFSSK